MNCSYCGQNLPDESTFCNNCGKKVDLDPQSLNNDLENKQDMSIVSEQPLKKKKHKR
ncbi:zinc-ribbon domain-containing protein [Paenibacillus silvae]|jgi:predicted amidophosphoribosyltransferase|uniref:zinc-ribbon domain-containing protein n=1 Tax=Paenibacillus TaxID=44249 RepID=UPI00338DF260